MPCLRRGHDEQEDQVKHPKTIERKSTLHYEMRPAIQNPAVTYRTDPIVLDIVTPFEVSTDMPPSSFSDETAGWAVKMTTYTLALKKATGVKFGYFTPSTTDTRYMPADRGGPPTVKAWRGAKSPFKDASGTSIKIIGVELRLVRIEPYEGPAERSRDNTGTCSVCFRNIKLDKKAMALHGYRRPGIGHIYGSCFGVKYPPYEVSTEGCKAWKLVLEHEKKNVNEHLAELRSGKIHEVSPYGGRSVKRGAPGWEDALNSTIVQYAQHLREVEEDIETSEKATRLWRKMALPGKDDAAMPHPLDPGFERWLAKKAKA